MGRGFNFFTNNIMNSTNRFACLGVVAVSLSLLAACNKQSAPKQMPPTIVSTVTVKAERLGVINELPGRLEAARIAEVRARVPGVVLKRTFEEGSEIKKGQLLFRIDPAAYNAALASAKATLAKAEASLAQMALKRERYAPLVEINAISKQEFDDVDAAHKLAVAEVASAKASVITAKLNLGYANVRSPISGKIGRAMVTEGALVGQTSATQLALVQKLDPMYVNLTQSSAAVLKLRKAQKAGELVKSKDGGAQVKLILEDGSEYAHKGTLLFSDITVDESTGMVSIRASFPNPERELLPGTFVRARVPQAVSDHALAVPQQAVLRTNSGAMVMVVNEKGIVETRSVTTPSSYGDKWIIGSGLKAGDNVIVEGLQKARVGAKVMAMPWGEKPTAAAGKQTASANKADDENKSVAAENKTTQAVKK